MEKSTISMAIFHCYVSSPKGSLKPSIFVAPFFYSQTDMEHVDFEKNGLPEVFFFQQLMANLHKENNHTKWGPRSIAKLVYNSNNYGLWHL